MTESAKRSDPEAKGNDTNGIRTLTSQELDRQTPDNTKDVVAKHQEVVEAGLAEKEEKNATATLVVLRIILPEIALTKSK